MTETLFYEESSKKNIRMVCVLKYVACAQANYKIPIIFN